MLSKQVEHVSDELLHAGNDQAHHHPVKVMRAKKSSTVSLCLSSSRMPLGVLPNLRHSPHSQWQP